MLLSLGVGVFEVVVEPHRRAILDALRERDRSVSELVPLLQLAQPTVSKHLKALREAGLVTVRPEAQRRYYRLRPEPLRELDELAPAVSARPGRTDWTHSGCTSTRQAAAGRARTPGHEEEIR